MNIRPIHSEADYEWALERIDGLWNAEPDTPEYDELDILATLVEAYEAKNYPIDAPDPVQALKFRMEQLGLHDNDLVPFMGQRSRVSEVLNYQRGLSLAMIRRLSQGLKIPAEILVREYKLQ